MRERTRLIGCRIAFLALCVAPTALTSGWIAYRVSPLGAAAERAHWTRLVAEHLGLQATLTGIEQPRRGVVLLQRLALTDPDSQRLVARVRLVEVVCADQGTVVRLSQPEVEEGQFLRLWEILHDRLLRGGAAMAQVQLSAGEVTVRARPQAATFTDVRCTLGSHASGTKAAIEFRVAGIDMLSPAEIQIVRSRQVVPPLTRWHLQTGATPLPCSLFADYCRPLRRLGRDCRFQGSVWTEQAADGWNGEIAGCFRQLDLQQLMDPFPHKLSGLAEVTFTPATFRQGRLKEAAGALRCAGGVMSDSLLTTFGQAFQLVRGPRRPEGGDPFEFRQLACGFQLDAYGIKLSGLCDPATPGALLVDRMGPLLSDSSSEPAPAVALSQALSPENALQVPATAETDLLLRALPLPNSKPSTNVASRPSYNSVRLRTQ